MWVEITYPSPNFNGCNVEVCEGINNFTPQVISSHLSTLGLKLNHISKKAPGNKKHITLTS